MLYFFILVKCVKLWIMCNDCPFYAKFNKGTGCPRKNGALACCYNGANAPFFLGHPVADKHF